MDFEALLVQPESGMHCCAAVHARALLLVFSNVHDGTAAGFSWGVASGNLCLAAFPLWLFCGCRVHILAMASCFPGDTFVPRTLLVVSRS